MKRDDEGQRGAGEELLLRVAWHYYKDELTQDEIARRLSTSRASVGRMLDRARKVGLVSITLNAEHLASFELASRLREAFDLTEVLVVPDYAGQPSSQRAVNARLGLGGAQYLSTHLRPGGSIGVGWGDTMLRVLAATDIGAVGPIHLVTLTGGVDGYLQALIHSRAERERLTASVIPSPIVASTPALSAALRDEPTIQQVIELARSLKLAVVGVGTAAPDSTLVQMGYMSADDARVLTEKGVAGDILGQFFDVDGNPLDLPIHERRIGIDLDDLRNIGRVVGVAGGAAKTEAILGAIRGGYLNVLVTDEGVAQRLLELA